LNTLGVRDREEKGAGGPEFSGGSSGDTWRA
jgi:hypothetical protein